MNYENIQKLCHLHNFIFDSIKTCYILSVLLCHPPPVLITKITNFRMRVRKVVVYMDASAYQVIWKEVENRIFKHNCIFRHMCMYKQPIFISSVIIRFMCKHYIIYILRYTERLLNVFFLLLAVILSELHEKPRRKDWVTEKST